MAMSDAARRPPGFKILWISLKALLLSGCFVCCWFWEGEGSAVLLSVNWKKRIAKAKWYHKIEHTVGHDAIGNTTLKRDVLYMQRGERG